MKLSKTSMIILLLIALICTHLSLLSVQRQVKYYRQQAATYRQAYERVCRQTRVPVRSNFDGAMAGD